MLNGSYLHDSDCFNVASVLLFFVHLPRYQTIVLRFLSHLSKFLWVVFPFQRREREMQQKLEEKDENTVEIKETFTSLQQEVDSKTKKLKKVKRG